MEVGLVKIVNLRLNLQKMLKLLRREEREFIEQTVHRTKPMMVGKAIE